jgi:hypothetical protein
VRHLHLGVLGLCLSIGLAAAGKTGLEPIDPKEPTCGNHGTSVEFLDTPAKAAAAAKKDGKLVMVLHVSGHFEDPRFT